jgi:hypothetical protein
MGITRIIGLVFLSVGMVLLLVGLDASPALGERVVEGTTSNLTRQTMWFLIGGVAILGGSALALGGRRATE